MAERLLLPAIVFAAMFVEARRAAANERAQRALGGVEPPHDVYRLMRVVYPGAFAAMFVEGALRPQGSRALVFAGAVLFGAAKLLKWWAIISLRQAWTFRVIVVRGATLVRRGPYRLLRHPNYVGVIGELCGVALITGAFVSGTAAVLLFGWLIVRRVSVEEHALREAAR